MTVIAIGAGGAALYSAGRARKSNRAQVITIDAWLVSGFEGGRSAPKVEKMEEIDRRCHSVPTA